MGSQDVAVGVLTYNALSSLRLPLLERTLASIEKAFPVADRILFDNGSTDGSIDWCLDFCGTNDWRCSWHAGDNTSAGAGRNKIHALMRFGSLLGVADVFVFSDDDMEWKPGAQDKVVEIWKNAPADIAIVSGLLEPVWHWNTPRETVKCGSVPVLVRDSCSAAAWTMRADAWQHVGPLRETMDELGEDYDACQRIAEVDFRVAQVDLAEHIGWGYSLHGNDADQHLDGRPLDRERWGV
jgi:glycosyltransferase involved in cell wall biosynthesis